MSFGDTFAFCAVVIGIISLAGMLLEGYKRRLANRERELELRARIAGAERGAGSTRADDVEERLRALEAIVTDPSQRLSREIDGLRLSRMDKETA